MKFLILSDGRMGHLNQSIAYAKQCEAEYEIIHVTFTCKFFKLLSYAYDALKIYSPKLFALGTPLSNSYDKIVSAGSSTYYANKTLSKQHHIPSVVMMLPKNYRYDFETIFAQRHDHPPTQDNIIEIEANFSFVEPKGLYEPKKASIGLIIGGNNSYFHMDKERLKKQLDFIFEHYNTYEIAVTTSPRTPKEIEALIKSYPFAYQVIFSERKMNPIADFLHHCETVFITMDSTSMISEAISYGDAAIEILPLNDAQNNKFFTMTKELEQQGYVHIFDDHVENKHRKIDFKVYAQKSLL